MSIQAYILHSKACNVREESMNKVIDKLKTDLKADTYIVTDFDVDKIAIDQVRKFVDLNKSTKSEFFDSIIRNLHIKNVSNALKHHTALNLASKDTKHDFFLFLEDDVLFGEDLTTKLTDVMKSYENEKWDILFMGQPSLAPIENQAKIVYKDAKESFKLLPTCDAYMIHKSNIERINNAFVPIKYSTNIHFSYLIETLQLNAMYTTPNIFLDGSKMGVYLSTIETNNRLFMNPEYNQLRNIVQKETYTDRDKEDIEKLLENIKFKNHPDIQLQIGMYHDKCGEYEKAKEIYESVYEIYKQNDCVLNNESDILSKLIAIQKHFQD